MKTMERMERRGWRSDVAAKWSSCLDRLGSKVAELSRQLGILLPPPLSLEGG